MLSMSKFPTFYSDTKTEYPQGLDKSRFKDLSLIVIS